MPFNYPRNASLIGDKIDTSKSGVYNLTSSSLYPYVSNPLLALSAQLSLYTEASAVSDVVSSFSSSGFDVIATPTYNAAFEQLVGQTGSLSTKGKFRYDLFDEANSLGLTSSFGDIEDGHPWIGMAAFAPNYLGMVIMGYNEYGAGTQLKELFYPNQYRSLQAYYLAPDLSEQSFTTANSTTIMSNSQQPSVNGYYNTSRFSADDGVFGYAASASLNGNGGGYLSTTAGHFGIQNPNSGDASANDVYWNGSVTVSTTYAVYLFIQRV
jgi:hypothetical protein